MKLYGEAIAKIRPGSNWGLSPADELIVDEIGNVTNLWWSESNSSVPPTAKEIEDAHTIVLAEYQAREYQRAREPEYPPLADLADAIYWQQQGDSTKMDAYIAKVEAVKNKYPKGV